MIEVISGLSLSDVERALYRVAYPEMYYRRLFNVRLFYRR